MKNFKTFIKESEDKQAMEDWFFKRTNKHIELVKKYCKKIADLGDHRFKGIMQQAEHHDESKFHNPELDPYVHIAWQYHMKDQGEDYNPPEDTKDKMNASTEHHVKHNKHHPEYWSDTQGNTINREDRDKPPEHMIDATKMSDLSIGEMCADWMAMSEEKDSNPIDWVRKNVNVRWKFTDSQTKLIYDLIEKIWNK
jgi:hypothetical protein